MQRDGALKGEGFLPKTVALSGHWCLEPPTGLMNRQYRLTFKTDFVWNIKGSGGGRSIGVMMAVAGRPRK